ncbi:MAG: 5' nucleotidase, NT5C type, partial [archaeon]
FLDLDGVITNWVKSVADLLDIDIKDNDIRKKIKEGYKIDQLEGISTEKMWKKINEQKDSFWKNLELTPWSKKLVNKLKETNHNLSFLTAPGSSASSFSGKKKFIDKHFPGTSLIITQDKHFCAHYNAILIDDSPNKIDKFNAWGGNTFLWPDILTFEDEENDVDEVIDDLMTIINNINLN